MSTCTKSRYRTRKDVDWALSKIRAAKLESGKQVPTNCYPCRQCHAWP